MKIYKYTIIQLVAKNRAEPNALTNVVWDEKEFSDSLWGLIE